MVLLLYVQQLCKCSHVLGYALMLLVEVNGGLSHERGGGRRQREGQGPEVTWFLGLSCVTAGCTVWSQPTVTGDNRGICQIKSRIASQTLRPYSTLHHRGVSVTILRRAV